MGKDKLMRILLMTLITFSFLTLIHHVAKADELVTVQLKREIGDSTHLSVKFQGDYNMPGSVETMKEGETYTLQVKHHQIILEGDGTKHSYHQTMMFIPSQYNQNHFITINDQPYLGAMMFKIENNNVIRPINQLPLEDYLKGVVPFEAYPSWGLETLKAQALAARTYAYKHLNQKMDDTINYQVYGGYQWRSRATQAVNETSGEVITYKGQLINAFFSSSNGGKTESNDHVWGGNAKPYFPIKKDPFDPVHSWKFSFNQTQMDLENMNWMAPGWWESTKEANPKIAASIKKWLVNKGYSSDMKILSIPQFSISKKRNEADRSLRGSFSVVFVQRFFGGLVHIDEVSLNDVPLNHIRPIIGGTIFKSYYIDQAECQKGVCTVKGRGYGHGVGMSQWGANTMGERGVPYQKIIHFYYPGTKIQTRGQETATMNH